MKDSREIKSKFQDMQQHPKLYSDKEIEAIIEEQDKPVDTEAAWRDFSSRHNVSSKETKTHLPRWLSGIAAVAVIALGVWAVIAFSAKQDMPIEYIAESSGQTTESETASLSEIHAVDTNIIAQITTLPEVKPKAHTDSRPTTPEKIIYVRGTGSPMPDKEPIVIVNGQKLQSLGVLDAFKTEDIDSIRVYKDEKKKAEYEPRFGAEVKNGIIEIRLKKGRETAYADILNLVGEDRATIFCSDSKQAEFPGGQTALRAYLKENLKYPAEVPDSSVTGRIIVNFVVNTDGRLSDFKIYRSMLKNADKTACKDSAIIDIFTKEAIRVCREMPDWIPGEQYTKDGIRKVNARYMLPILFGKEKSGNQGGIRIR